MNVNAAIVEASLYGDGRWGNLARAIRDKSIQKGKFVLKSGKESTYYIDLRPVLMSSEAYYLSSILLKFMKILRLDHIGGPETEAIPIAAAVAMRGKNGFYIRKLAKDHGTKSRLEGNIPVPGSRVLLVDGTVTTGSSLMDAYDCLLAKHDVRASVALAVVDRLEGAKELFEEKGVPYVSVYRINELLEMADAP